MPTTLINLRHTKECDSRIDRTSPFGNRHRIGHCDICNRLHDRPDAVKAYKDDFYKRILTDSIFRDKIHALKNKVLGCWCFPDLCHGMVILEYLEGIPYETTKPIDTTDFFG